MSAKTIKPKLLAWSFALSTGTLIISLLGLLLDSRVVTGDPVWLKPLKFSVSILILLWTYAQYWKWVALKRGMRALFNVSGALLAIEMVLIVIQAARGVPSHFNLTTPWDMAVFSAMGVSIGAFWFGSMWLLGAFFKITPDRLGFVWAARLGLVLGIIGMGLAWTMTGPNADQLAKIQEHGSPIGGVWGGGHSVGVLEDAPGSAITGWKLSGGDLRVAHFLGLHGMQILWILTLFLARAFPGMTLNARLRLQVIVFLVLLGTTLEHYFRALRGLPYI